MVTLTTDNLNVTLGKRQVLNDICMHCEAGKFIGVVGPNGAGKSTLVRTLLGLLPSSSGRVLLNGMDISTLDAGKIARSVAYLPQGSTLHWPLTVERLVALGRLPHLAPMSRITRDDRDAVVHAMDRANVTHLRSRIATELSGGERARVMLARALAVGAPALIADEPLASLDPGHQIDVMELLTREAREGALIIAVLHDLTMAARYCDRVILVAQGCVVADGPPMQVLTPDRMRQVYGIETHVDLETSTILPIARAKHS